VVELDKHRGMHAKQKLSVKYVLSECKAKMTVSQICSSSHPFHNSQRFLPIKEGKNLPPPATNSTFFEKSCQYSSHTSGILIQMKRMWKKELSCLLFERCPRMKIQISRLTGQELFFSLKNGPRVFSRNRWNNLKRRVGDLDRGLWKLAKDWLTPWAQHC